MAYTFFCLMSISSGRPEVHFTLEAKSEIQVVLIKSFVIHDTGYISLQGLGLQTLKLNLA